MFYCYYESMIGTLTLVSDGECLIALKPNVHRYYDKICNGEILNDSLEIFVKTKLWLDAYFNGDKPSIKDLNLKLCGSDFRLAVWDILCEIPYGKVVSYKDIAMKIAKKRNLKGIPSQAVGGAVGNNPISIIIPCHRVVGTDGSLTGYGGGIENKVKLLSHEGVDVEMFYMPVKGNAL